METADAKCEVTFTTEWLDRATDNKTEEKVCLSQFSMDVNGVCITKNGDRTPQKGIVISTYPLAMWICEFFWRIVYEPMPSTQELSSNWRIAHEMSAANSGFVWPPIKFLPDGDYIKIISERKNVDRFSFTTETSQIVKRESLINFFKSLILATIERSKSKNFDDTNLSDIWSQLDDELADSNMSLYRIIEALLGFDPDEAPEVVMKRINAMSRWLDSGALKEIATISSVNETDNVIKSFDEAHAMAGSGILGKWNEDFFAEKIDDALPSWEIGRQCAKQLRNSLKIKDGPIKSEILYDLLSITSSSIKKHLPLGERYSLSRRENNQLHINFKREGSLYYSTSMRFHLSRLIGALYSSNQEHQWILITPCKTRVQKIQRSFASEFLAPIDHIVEVLGDKIESSGIAKAASYFQVSPQMITHSLTNQGYLPVTSELNTFF